MKKIFLFWIVSLLLLAACETESDEWKDESYTSFSISFLNVPNQDYRVVFNGVESTTGFVVPMDDLTGELEVYEKESNTLKLEATITVVPRQVIQLIKLPGKPVAFYDEDSYTTFNLNVFYLSGQEDLYTAYFGGQECSKGMNYISRDELTGTLEIYTEGAETPAFAQEDITLEPEAMVNILQLSDTEFLYLEGGGDEEAPESDDFTKVRVFYTPDDLLTEDSYTMNVYAMLGWSYDAEGAIPLGTIEIKSGELSPYILVDMRTFQDYGEPLALTYDLITESGEMIADHLSYMIDLYPETKSDDLFKSKYKFQTSRISDNYGYPVGVLAFGEEWETSAAE